MRDPTMRTTSGKMCSVHGEFSTHVLETTPNVSKQQARELISLFLSFFCLSLVCLSFVFLSVFLPFDARESLCLLLFGQELTGSVGRAGASPKQWPDYGDLPVGLFLSTFVLCLPLWVSRLPAASYKDATQQGLVLQGIRHTNSARLEKHKSILPITVTYTS